jgi:hypothetical protein
MNTTIPFAATGLFVAGAAAGIIGVVTVVIRREGNLTLTSPATDHATRAGRWLNGVGVGAPRRAAADRETTFAQPASGRAQGPGTPVQRASAWPSWTLRLPTRAAARPTRRKRRRGITLVWSEGFHQGGSQ